MKINGYHKQNYPNGTSTGEKELFKVGYNDLVQMNVNSPSGNEADVEYTLSDAADATRYKKAVGLTGGITQITFEVPVSAVGINIISVTGDGITVEIRANTR